MTSLSAFATDLNLWEIKDFSIQILYGILADSSKYYRSFEIPKRRGGNRTIHSPYPVLAQIQKELLLILQDRCGTSEYAYAYCRGKNAIMHASAHLGCDELLTVDVENFFGSTTRQQVHQALLGASFENDFAHLASLVATLHGVLPQGASTSPLLSNVVFRPLDGRLARLASHLQIKYTRYADDLAFSGDKIPRNLPKLIGKIISEKGYKLNPGKTALKIRGAKKIITGVSISSGTSKAPRQFVRATRAAVHNLEKNIGKLSATNILDPLAYERTLGKINYWLQIEPHNYYAAKKKKILSEAHQRFLELGAGFNLDNYIENRT
ncbi:reverse transcriptase family protein [Achromobacter xylosoxidans]|uniref:reverse transcriptase family protein n=1 Tax=Alcaligenes xylosoxydans xylosoxydans TaxID=85698 RepID=UPI0009F65FE6|nr:reverse transcriptase family protein [Achromobacter xylosoxidans]